MAVSTAYFRYFVEQFDPQTSPFHLRTKKFIICSGPCTSCTPYHAVISLPHCLTQWKKSFVVHHSATKLYVQIGGHIFYGLVFVQTSIVV